MTVARDGRVGDSRQGMGGLVTVVRELGVVVII